MTLPLLTVTQAPATESDSDQVFIEPCDGGRALVVDDDATNRWLSQRQLSKLGWTVDVAEDGLSALAMLESQPYDLLLTDCHMPNMDGVALARAVRAHVDPARRCLPIIGLTADATAAQRERCLDAGMGEIAIKPVRRVELSRLLKLVLPSQEAARPQSSGAIASAADLPPVFDDTYLRELFEPGDREVNVWIAEYQSVSADIVAHLENLLAPGSLTSASRARIASAAHRLAGSSLSMGATRLGVEAKRLETASLNGAADDLAMHYAILRNELEAARVAIGEFATAFTADHAIAAS